MRRFDKLKNIEKANMLAEQRYFESKGIIKESNGKVWSSYENKYVDDVPDEEESPEELAKQAAKVARLKNKILKAVPEYNAMVAKAVDGFGDPMQFKVWPNDPDLGEIYPIEINGDILTLGSSEFTEDYDLNNPKHMSTDSSWDPQLPYYFNRFYNLLKKGIAKLEGGQNYYPFYIIDVNNKVLDAQSGAREWAENELKSSYYDEPGARVVSLKKLIELGGKPIVVGG